MGKRKITIDFVTYDPKSGEFVLYLVENGPWPETETEWKQCLGHVQNRVLGAFDIAVDGHLADIYPESKGVRVRIQIDSPNGMPNRLSNLVERIQNYIKTDEEYLNAVENSKYVSGLRVVTGHQMGRFQK